MLDSLLFKTLLKSARDLAAGDTLDLAGGLVTVMHVATDRSGRVVRGEYSTGRSFRFGVADQVRVQEAK